MPSVRRHYADFGRRLVRAEMTDRVWGRYFSIVSTLLLLLSIVAFSDNLFTDVGQPSNRDPKF
jgi:hypothetical protein